jgi:proline iminopeptidase
MPTRIAFALAAAVAVELPSCAPRQDAPSYFDDSGRDDVVSGGAKLIPISTPKGSFKVWMK